MWRPMYPKSMVDVHPMHPPPCRPLTGAVMPAWRFSRRCLAESPQRAPRCLLRVGGVGAHPENRKITDFPENPKNLRNPHSEKMGWGPQAPPPVSLSLSPRKSAKYQRSRRRRRRGGFLTWNTNKMQRKSAKFWHRRGWTLASNFFIY